MSPELFDRRSGNERRSDQCVDCPAIKQSLADTVEAVKISTSQHASFVSWRYVAALTGIIIVVFGVGFGIIKDSVQEIKNSRAADLVSIQTSIGKMNADMGEVKINQRVMMSQVADLKEQIKKK